MAERGDALDVVADVRRRAVGAGVAVVDHRERAPPAFRRRGGRRVRVGRDPLAHPVAVEAAPLPRCPVLLQMALEARERIARELAVAVPERGGHDVVPGLGAHLGRVVGDERADLGECVGRRDGQARAHVLGRREPRPQRPRHAPQLVPGELHEAAPEGDDPSAHVAHHLRLGLPAQRLRQRLRGVVTAGPDERARLRHERLLDRLAALQRAQQRRVRYGARWRGRRRPGLARRRLRRGRRRRGRCRGSAPEAGERRRRRPAQRAERLASGRGQPAREAPGGAARPSHGRRAASRGARAGSRRGP